MRQTGKYKAELTLLPCLCAKSQKTVLTAIIADYIQCILNTR